MQVLFINNEGEGFAGKKDIGEGDTVEQFFRQQMGEDTNPNDFTIRVNRDNVDASYVLQEGDRVSFTPAKIEGA